MKKLVAMLGILLLLTGTAQAHRSKKHKDAPTTTTMRVITPKAVKPLVQHGVASYYTTDEQGYRTASGRRLQDNALTAAHKTLPFGTKVKVTNVKTEKSVIVEITDRGPYVGGRPIDLTRAAFAAIASTKQGLVKVRVETLPVYTPPMQLASLAVESQRAIWISLREIHPTIE